MLRMVNRMGDRLLGLFVPEVKAAAADCGTTKVCSKCRTIGGRRLWHTCTCWTNSNCTPYNCVPTTTFC